MLRLVFESETVEYLLPNAPGRFRAGGKNHECGTGRDELVECAKLVGIPHLYNILHQQCNLLARTLCAQCLDCQKTLSASSSLLNFGSAVSSVVENVRQPIRSSDALFRDRSETPTLVTCNNLVQKVLVTVNHVQQVFARVNSLVHLLSCQCVRDKS